MKTEIWNGYAIRFVEKDGGWWAVAADVATALNFRDAFNATKHLEEKYKGTTVASTPYGQQEMLTYLKKVSTDW